MEIDRVSAPSVRNRQERTRDLVERAGALTIASRFDGEAVEPPSPTPAAAIPGTSALGSSAVLTHEAAGAPGSALDHRQIAGGARRRGPLDEPRPWAATFTIRAADPSEWRMADPATLLVADDDPGLRESLERTSAREGYKVGAASDGRAAAERVRPAASPHQ